MALLELGLALLNIGCHFAHGFGMAKPIPSESLRDWHDNWREERIWHQLGLKNWSWAKILS
ncbi:MAG: hypothetical protein AB2604_01770 [Candidatus Thiodiazotropha taylori]